MHSMNVWVGSHHFGNQKPQILVLLFLIWCLIFSFFFFGQFKIFIDYRKQIVKGEQPSNTNTPTVEEALQEGKANSAHMQEKKNYRKSVKQQLSVFLITRPSNIKNNILYNLMTRSNSLIENLVVSLLPNTIDCLCKAHGI